MLTRLKKIDILKVGMHDIIGLISESAHNGFKCKYRYRSDMTNYADMSCRYRGIH